MVYNRSLEFPRVAIALRRVAIAIGVAQRRSQMITCPELDSGQVRLIRKELNIGTLTEEGLHT